MVLGFQEMRTGRKQESVGGRIEAQRQIISKERHTEMRRRRKRSK
jgi:hypothetical protein